MKMKNDKKAQLIISIFKYGKKHVGQLTLYHKINYGIYKILNAIFVIGFLVLNYMLHKVSVIILYYFIHTG